MRRIVMFLAVLHSSAMVLSGSPVAAYADEPSPTPTATATASPEPSPTPTVSPSPSPTAAPTPTPSPAASGSDLVPGGGGGGVITDVNLSDTLSEVAAEADAVIRLAEAVVTACLDLTDTTCRAAVEAQQQLRDFAQACVDGEQGDAYIAGVNVGLDCAELVNTALAVAGQLVTVATGCLSGADPTCGTALTLAAAALDAARTCLTAAWTELAPSPGLLYVREADVTDCGSLTRTALGAAGTVLRAAVATAQAVLADTQAVLAAAQAALSVLAECIGDSAAALGIGSPSVDATLDCYTLVQQALAAVNAATGCATALTGGSGSDPLGCGTLTPSPSPLPTVPPLPTPTAERCDIPTCDVWFPDPDHYQGSEWDTFDGSTDPASADLLDLKAGVVDSTGTVPDPLIDPGLGGVGPIGDDTLLPPDPGDGAPSKLVISQSHYVNSQRATSDKFKSWGSGAPTGSQVVFIQFGKICSETTLSFFGGGCTNAKDVEDAASLMTWWASGFASNSKHYGSSNVYLAVGTNNSGTTSSSVNDANARYFYHNLVWELQRYLTALNNRSQKTGTRMHFVALGADDIEIGGLFNDSAGTTPWVSAFNSASANGSTSRIALYNDAAYFNRCNTRSCWDTSASGWSPHQFWRVVWGYTVAFPVPQHYNKNGNQGGYWKNLRQAAASAGASPQVAVGVMTGCYGYEASANAGYNEYVREAGESPTYLTDQFALSSDTGCS